MTAQRIELLCQARALITKAMNHRCTTELEEWSALYDITAKIDKALSPWDQAEYEREQSAKLRRWEKRQGIPYGSRRSAFLPRQTRRGDA